MKDYIKYSLGNKYMRVGLLFTPSPISIQKWLYKITHKKKRGYILCNPHYPKSHQRVFEGDMLPSYNKLGWTIGVSMNFYFMRQLFHIPHVNPAIVIAQSH